MADVGQLAGVSAATVSFVINDRQGQTISESTRRRVLRAVEELGYRPNRTARGLRTRRSDTIGFVNHETAEDSYAAPAMSGTHDVAWSRGSSVLLVNTNRSREILKASLRDLLDRQVDAIIIAAAGTRSLTLPEPVPVPTILVNCFAPGDAETCVLPDEVGGGRDQARLALDAGHRRIALLAGTRGSWATRARVRGWRESFDASGLTWSSGAVAYGNFEVESGFELVERMLAQGPPPTAVLCGNDRMALGALLALSQAGLSVPADVSVIGFDDQVGLASHLHPKLTTIQLPYYRMGQWATEQLLDRRLGLLPRRTYLSCTPVVRDSLGPPASSHPWRRTADRHNDVAATS